MLDFLNLDIRNLSLLSLVGRKILFLLIGTTQDIDYRLIRKLTNDWDHGLTKDVPLKESDRLCKVVELKKKLILKTYPPPNYEFWTSNLRSNSGFIDLWKVLYVSNEPERSFPQYYILNSTTLHSRPLPLRIDICLGHGSGPGTPVNIPMGPSSHPGTVPMGPSSHPGFNLSRVEERIDCDKTST